MVSRLCEGLSRFMRTLHDEGGQCPMRMSWAPTADKASIGVYLTVEIIAQGEAVFEFLCGGPGWLFV